MLLLNCCWTTSESSQRAVRRRAHVQGQLPPQWTARELQYTPEDFFPSPPTWLRKTRGQRNNHSLKLQVWEEFQKPSLRRTPQQSKTLGNLKLGWRRKKPLIIKCCLCKMKNHTVPSGHNSPGKPSMYVTRQEAKLMHRGGAAAAHANSTSNLLCKAHSPCMAFHAGVRYLSKSSALTEQICLSHWKEDLPLPFYLPCSYLHSPLDNSICILNTSIHSSEAPPAPLWHQCLPPILLHLHLHRFSSF